jgi:hypothetical protein
MASNPPEDLSKLSGLLPTSGGKLDTLLPPTLPPQVRWLALVMGVRLRVERQSLEHGCYTETASLNKGGLPVSISA